MLYLLVIVGLTFTAYSFMVNEAFKTMDDEFCIVNNAEIKDLRNVGKLFTHCFFGAGSYYRPLVSLSFMLEYHVFGLSPFYFYLTNIFIHLATSLLVFALMRIILRRDILAFAAALLFALHPVQWEAVSNIPGRAILLAAFFTVNAFLLFCRREENKWAIWISLASFILGLLCKETAAVLPLVLVAYRWLLEAPPQQRADSATKKWLAILIPVIPFFALEAVYLLVRRLFGVTKFYYWPDIGQALLGLLTFLRSLIMHIRLFLFPYDLHFDRSYRLFENFRNPEVWLTALFWLALLGLSWIYRKKIAPLVIFLGFWFLIEFAPVSQFLVSVGVQPGYISAAEHFLYTPSLSFLALAVLAVAWLYEHNQRRKIISATLFKCVIVASYAAYFLVTVEQNIYSSNEIAMFERTLELNPTNTRIRYNLGYVYAQKRLYADAAREFRRVVQVMPEIINARIALGKALCDQGKLWDGVREYEAIADAGDLKALLAANRNAAYQLLRLRYIEQIKNNPADPVAHYSLGVVYSKMGKLLESIASYKEAVALKPDFRDALFNLASTTEATGQFKEAAVFYERMLTLPVPPSDPLSEIALTHLAQIYQKLGDSEKAGAYNTKVQEIRVHGR